MTKAFDIDKLDEYFYSFSHDPDDDLDPDTSDTICYVRNVVTQEVPEKGNRLAYLDKLTRVTNVFCAIYCAYCLALTIFIVLSILRKTKFSWYTWAQLAQILSLGIV